MQSCNRECEDFLLIIRSRYIQSSCTQCTCLPPALLKVLGRSVLLRVVLVGTVVVDVVLIVHALCVPLGLVLCLLPVEPVLALCLGELVDLGTGEASEQLLGERVRNRLAYVARVSNLL